MSHTTVVYPNGMVEVVFDDEDAELGCCGVEDTETDPVSDALDALDEHFENYSTARFMIQALRTIHADTSPGSAIDTGALLGYNSHRLEKAPPA